MHQMTTKSCLMTPPSTSSRKEDMERRESKATWKSVNTHTYTRASHENLLRGLTQAEVEGLRKQNESLKRALEKAEEDGRRKRTQIEQLEKELATKTRHERHGRKIYRVGDRETVEFEVVSGDPEEAAQLLIAHFGEVMKRHRRDLAEKDVRISELRRLLAECRAAENAPPLDDRVSDSGRRERQLRVHDFQGDERLRRTGAAVKELSEGLELVKKTVRDAGPVGRYKARGSGSEEVLAELNRRRGWGAAAELQRLADCFSRRLKLELELDKRHWRLESDRLAVYKQSAGDKFDPRCAYNKDFEQLEITRHRLLRALAELRAKRGADEENERSKSDKAEGPPITTLQTLYQRPDKNKTKIYHSSASEFGEPAKNSITKTQGNPDSAPYEFRKIPN